MKVLQIGLQHYFRKLEGDFISTCLVEGAIPYSDVNTKESLIKELIKVLSSDKEYDLVALRCLGPLNKTNSLYSIPKKVVRNLIYSIAVKYQAKKTPVIIIDQTDHITIHPSDKKLLNICDLYFKRELARNYWNTFERILPVDHCIGHIQRDPSYNKWKDKLRPVSLGYGGDIMDPLEKKYDFFYVGQNRGIQERTAIENALAQIKQQGYNVHAPVEALSQKEFIKAVRESWFSPSPMGGGWDCFRHYEIVAYGSIPLVSQPSILAHKPFGSHNDSGVTIDYSGNLSDQLVAATSMTDSEKNNILRTSRTMIESYHTFDALGKYLLSEVEKIKYES